MQIFYHHKRVINQDDIWDFPTQHYFQSSYASNEKSSDHHIVNIFNTHITRETSMTGWATFAQVLLTATQSL
jgi:hypothetical protein